MSRGTSFPRSPLHDAAEAGDSELIVKLLAKEQNDGDFNPVGASQRFTLNFHRIIPLARPTFYWSAEAFPRARTLSRSAG